MIVSIVDAGVQNQDFCRRASTEGLGDDALAFAVAEMERGLTDARLGGQVVTKRVDR
jgi:hypothetical protein